MVRTYPYPLPLPRFGIRIHVTGDEWQIALFCSFSCPSSAAHVITPHSPFGFWCTIPTSDSNTAADNTFTSDDSLCSLSLQCWPPVICTLIALLGHMTTGCWLPPRTRRYCTYILYIYTCASLWNGVCVCVASPQGRIDYVKERTNERGADGRGRTNNMILNWINFVIK